MTGIADSLAAVEARIAQAASRSGRCALEVRLLVVTKTIAPARLIDAIAAGARDFGENKVQEGRLKANALMGNRLRWSMIGHLQRNKVGEVLTFADEVQSLDRLPLAVVLEKQLQRLGRSLDVLVQVNTSGEASKYGVAVEEALTFLKELAAFDSLRLYGFMTLARFTNDVEDQRRCFRTLRTLRDRALQEAPQGGTLGALSMGMSGDFEVAIEEGATIVRVGQAVFGPRVVPDTYYWPKS